MQPKKVKNGKLLSSPSRYSRDYEAKCLVNELAELLAIAWAVEYLRSYFFGGTFEVVSDHKVLETELKRNHRNDTYISRLTSWIDTLLPFGHITQRL